jgi:GTP cyclohydrolase I
MRLVTSYHLREAMQAMKIDLTDENVAEDLTSGNIGTFGRVAKVWCGYDTHDTTEALSGRWNRKPRMASFPNTGKTDPVFVTTRLDAMCSHHLIRFGDDNADENSLVVVGYIPEERLGGISKINRFVEWCARRGWLQEDLTEYIGKEVEKAFETSSVYVALLNNKHGCASTRGANDREASTTSTYSSGKFKDDITLIPARFRG